MPRLISSGVVFFAVLFSLLSISPIEAQVPNQLLRDMIGTLQTLQRNGRAPSFDPSDPAGFQVAPRPNVIASKPTFDCTNVQSPLGLLLCGDPNAAKADWSVNAATWAYAGTLDADGRAAFQKDQDEWVQSVTRSCKLDRSLSETQRRCAIASYQARSSVLLAKLSGDALDEAQLAPERRAELQTRLIILGLSQEQPDGQFGPNTRVAIKSFQQKRGTAETGFLSRDERQALLAGGPSAQPQAQAPLNPDRVMRVAEPQAAQPGSRFPAQQGVSESAVSLGQPEAVRSGTKTVEVTGLGETADAARKDAARLAVQQVAGVYIDNRRRVETKMSADQVSTIVDEKILSYTNAYVSKFEPLSQACKDGNCSITARVTVNVAPLLQTLRASSVPTTEFDGNSAEAAATTLGAERASALATYKDLVTRLDELVTVSVGKADVNPSMPSSSGSVWLTIPLTFFANPSARKEWAQKFGLMADKRQQVSLNVTRRPNGPSCEMQGISPNTLPFQQDRTMGASVETVCFVSSVSRSVPGGYEGAGRGFSPAFAGGPRRYGLFATAECFGRTFVREEAATVSLQKRASSMQLLVELVDAEGKVLQFVSTDVGNFPELPVWESMHRAQNRQAAFLDFCAAGSNDDGLFYRAVPNGAGDSIIFPPEGGRMNALLNVNIPNDRVGQIARIRASLKNKS